jgi:arsenite-transporting ATPase
LWYNAGKENKKPYTGEYSVRILFYAGKGGVGKTSVAGATGVYSAEAGNRTVILSLDVAHSLSDVFDLERDLMDRNQGEPIPVAENLWIQEMDIQEEIQKNWGEIHGYVSALLNTTGLDEILAEELAVLPGMEEVSLLLYINRYVRQNTFDTIILDCAPTGESLRFISIPTTLEWYMKKVFKLERTIARYARPVARRFTDVPLPGDDYFAALERLFEQLDGVDRILTNPETTSVRLVTNPEKIVLKETQRAFMYFCLYRMNVDAVIMNRVLPEDVQDAYFHQWRESQARMMAMARDSFSPVPILPVHLLRSEVLGIESLRALASRIYKDRSPLEHFYDREPYRFVKENHGYCLSMTLPFVEKHDVELHRMSDELIVRVGGIKRHVLLPRPVAASTRIWARMEGRDLNIHFEGEDHGEVET